MQKKRLLTSQVGTEPEEKIGDPFILTRLKPCGPFSFVDRTKQKYDEKMPPPIYLQMTDINVKKKFSKEEIFRNLKIEKDGRLKLTNKASKEAQKGIIAEVLKQCGAKILEGSKIVGLSLPVRIFEPRSQIERLCNLFHFLPKISAQCLKEKDALERMKRLMAMIIPCLTHQFSSWKPFNPLLGETCEAKIGADITLHAEHISHHPPISAYYIVHPDWKMHGQWIYQAKISTYIINYYEGWMNLDFKDGQSFQISYPAIYLEGLVVGSRYMRPYLSYVCKNEDKKLKGVVRFGQNINKFVGLLKTNQTDRLKGYIVEYDPKRQQKLEAGKWYDMINKEFENVDKIEKAKQFVSKVRGSWLKQMTFDDEVY